MKTLIAMANYGTGNDRYLHQVLQEYRGMGKDVDIVVTSNIPKNLGPDIEVVVGLATGDPRSLPFVHKRIFAERMESYDLFVYAEDDNPVTKRNIDAFLRATEVLPPEEIAGFLRTERDSAGKLYFSEPHNHYHWDASSVCRRGDFTFAFYTNEHSGCYVLTREQLRRAIASGGFLVPFHHGEYPPLETAATDPYTQCGFRKLMCISHLDDFLVPHLSNRYAGRGALPAEDFYVQLGRLLSVSKNGKPKGTLFPVETNLLHRRWSKSYYEPRQDELIALIPKGAQSVLSIGCGWGVTERCLVERGFRVKAVPMDSVIAASAEARGVEIVYGDCHTALKKLANERFDCLLISNVLHLVRTPVEFLTPFVDLVVPGGCVVASVPNLSRLRRLSRRIRFRGHVADPKSYEAHGMHATTGRVIRRWLRQTGLTPMKMVYEVSDEKKSANRRSLGLATPLLASTIYVSAVRNVARPS